MKQKLASLPIINILVKKIRAVIEKSGLMRVEMSDYVLEKFYDQKVGAAYHVSKSAKEKLVNQFKNIHQNIPSGTSWLINVIMATEILKIPPKTKGDIIECGCWKGASTAGLSLVCKIAKRKLIVADSFQGLPEDDKEVVHQYPHAKIFGYYKKGMYSAALDEVRENISKYGDISVCQFLPGFFNNSLKSLKNPVVLAFLDVDLSSSMKDCIKYIWPKLIDNGYAYTDDSCDMEVVKVWFDNQWWQKNMKQLAPGYVGSGCGLPITTTYTSLGYALKVKDPQESYNRISWLVYPDKKNKKDRKKK